VRCSLRQPVLWQDRLSDTYFWRENAPTTCARRVGNGLCCAEPFSAQNPKNLRS
jgi:hypothetical protein